MSQPIAYLREFGFADFAAVNPTLPPPGVRLDTEFNSIHVTLEQTLANLALIQRDDGFLYNGIVGMDALDDVVQAALAGVAPGGAVDVPALQAAVLAAVNAALPADIAAAVAAAIVTVGGGNVVGLFSGFGAQTVPTGVTLVQTTGHGVSGQGAAIYVCDATANLALATAHPRFCKSDAMGRYFRFIGEYVTVEQAGALADGTNDQPAIQAAIDYAIATGIRKVKFTRSAYTLWTPIKVDDVWPAKPTGHPIVVAGGSVELEGVGGKTTLTQKGHLGGNIATEIQSTTGWPTWRGGFIRVGGTSVSMESLTLRNLVIDGTVPYVGAPMTDLSHKGIWCNNEDLINLYVFDCEMKNFLGEVFYLGGVKPDYCMVENLTLHDSPQSLWNAAALSKVVAINLDCYNSYQALEVISGKGHTYIGGRFAHSQTGSIIGTQIFGNGLPYDYPQRDPAAPPPWLTFLGTRFEWFGGLDIASWTRGNIVLVDTAITFGDNSESDIDLDIEAWCDHSTGANFVNVRGRTTTTDQIVGGPVGQYYTLPANVRINLVGHRTANAVAAGRSADGIIFTGHLIDKNTCFFEVSGDFRTSWKVNAPVAGFALPRIVAGINMGNGGVEAVYQTLTVSSTTALEPLRCEYRLTPSAAGVATANIAATYGYKDGQRVLFTLWDNASGAGSIKFPSGGTGLNLKEDRILSAKGDLIELEYSSYPTAGWSEVRFASSAKVLFTGSATYDAPSIAAAGTTTTTVTATGASLGDYVDRISLGVSAAGLVVTGYVSAANTVTVVLYNPTGGAVDLASTTLAVEVRKKS